MTLRPLAGPKDYIISRDKNWDLSSNINGVEYLFEYIPLYCTAVYTNNNNNIEAI